METIAPLLDEYGDAILSFCLHLTKNRQDGEDLFQETFLRAMELSGRIDRRQNPKSYLMSIAVNLWKNALRKQSRRQRIAPMVEPIGDESGGMADSGQDPAAEVQKRQQTRRLLSAVESLGDRYRIPILLYYAEELSIKEIAGVLSLPEGTVKRRLHDGKAKLRTILGGDDDAW